MEATIFYRGHVGNIGMMEKKMETTILYMHGLYWGRTGMMEKNMETIIACMYLAPPPPTHTKRKIRSNSRKTCCFTELVVKTLQGRPKGYDIEGVIERYSRGMDA